MRITEEKFINSRYRELEQLGECLIRNKAIIDPSSISGAMDTCKTNRARNGCPATWHCRVHSLMFPIIPDDALSKICPGDAYDVHLTLSIDGIGWCLDDGSDQDPFCTLGVDMWMTGKTISKVNDSLRTIICAWHLDRHITRDTKDPCSTILENQTKDSAVHPHYHWHFGGRRIWGLKDFGDQLILEPPRIAHPPLDAILAVDFVLSNFYHDKWETIRNDNQYMRLVEDAQFRFWRPYAFSLASMWSNSVASSWNPHKLWPQLWA